ncbi:hypothetical protein HHK36_005569 [Tetracentron sinense]|uniref:B box-type domain-containing protein n=1 Tax=Tetracentron sinense TaxID=13715 RepID=A0A834ZQK9_TETSI|nr:hypothetical protein HHK36_005569 [Tetracentron sinense]
MAEKSRRDLTEVNLKCHKRRGWEAKWNLFHLQLLEMCRGRDEERNQDGSGQSEIPMEVALLHETIGSVYCELCDSRASLYCQADDAFLCRKCDKWVHGANFLALRHIRCLLSDEWQNLTERYLIGTSVEVELPTIVSRSDRRRCTSKVQLKNSKKLKKWPSLFL